MKRHFRTTCLFLLTVCLLAACNLPAATPTAPPNTSTPTRIPPTKTPVPTLTFTPLPTETLTLTPTSEGMTISIDGSPEFTAQVKHSLELLSNCAPDALNTADIYIDTIQESDRSGMDVATGTYLVSETTAFAPGYLQEVQVYWLAGTIIHDARHRWQAENGINTSWDSLTLAEREAIEQDARGVQITAMELCLGQVSDENRYQAESLLTYLKDMQSGLIPCDYCAVDWSDRNW
jgi:hypothetical protein